MYTFLAFYNQRRMEIQAKTLLDAKNQAIAAFKVPKSKQHLVAVMLAEKDGESVVHRPDF